MSKIKAVKLHLGPDTKRVWKRLNAKSGPKAKPSGRVVSYCPECPRDTPPIGAGSGQRILHCPNGHRWKAVGRV